MHFRCSTDRWSRRLCRIRGGGGGRIIMVSQWQLLHFSVCTLSIIIIERRLVIRSLHSNSRDPLMLWSFTLLIAIMDGWRGLVSMIPSKRLTTFPLHRKGGLGGEQRQADIKRRKNLIARRYNTKQQHAILWNDFHYFTAFLCELYTKESALFSL